MWIPKGEFNPLLQRFKIFVTPKWIFKLTFLKNNELNFFLYLESPKNDKPTKPTTYGVSLQLKNIAQVPLTLKWEINGKQKSLDIDVGKKIRHIISMNNLEKPQPLVFRVYRRGGEQTGQINRLLSWEVQPVEKPLLTLLTLNYGKSLFCLMCICS